VSPCCGSPCCDHHEEMFGCSIKENKQEDLFQKENCVMKRGNDSKFLRTKTVIALSRTSKLLFFFFFLRRGSTT
jgi:hypothetical protein